ncbi:MAG: UbiA family prenyltransferase [Oscillochloris sp.]|nr:UbiA family prenyltransferase [Oscillochloris sp.]
MRTVPLTQSLIRLLIALIQVTRPQIALQAAAYTLLGGYLSQPDRIAFSGQLYFAAAMVGLVVSFGFLVNDDADYELDRATKPERPLVAGIMQRRHARALAAFLAASIALGSLLLPSTLTIFLLINLLLTLLYSVLFKRTVLLGNLCIAYLNASILLFGAIASAGSSLLVLAVAAMSFGYSFAQEVLYTVDDYAGDAMAGIMTTAGFFGVARSLWLFRGALFLAIGFALWPWWVGVTSQLYAWGLLLCTILPIMLRILPLTWTEDPQHIHQACRTVKWVRLSSLVPLLLIAVG